MKSTNTLVIVTDVNGNIDSHWVITFPNVKSRKEELMEVNALLTQDINDNLDYEAIVEDLKDNGYEVIPCTLYHVGI